MGGKDGFAVRLCIPAKPEYITLGRLALTGLSRIRPFPEDTLADLKRLGDELGIPPAFTSA